MSNSKFAKQKYFTVISLINLVELEILMVSALWLKKLMEKELYG